jgi:hypothetical protein
VMLAESSTRSREIQWNDESDRLWITIKVAK